MPMAKTRVNWHEAAVCAVKIDLRDYAQYLEYYSEYVLGKNNYRMDLLVVKKLSCEKFPKKIAHIFSTFNIFEIKGIGSSTTPDSYYKVNGYAGHLCQYQNYIANNIKYSLRFHYYFFALCFFHLIFLPFFIHIEITKTMRSQVLRA